MPHRRVLSAIRRGHERLQRALTRLYPGSLVLTLSANTIHHKLLTKITALNNVPEEPTEPEEPGVVIPDPDVPMGGAPDADTSTLRTRKCLWPA